MSDLIMFDFTPFTDICGKNLPNSGMIGMPAILAILCDKGYVYLSLKCIMHAPLSCAMVLVLNFIYTHILLPCLIYASSEGSGEPAQMRRLNRAFTLCHCEKYHFMLAG